MYNELVSVELIPIPSVFSQSVIIVLDAPVINMLEPTVSEDVKFDHFSLNSISFDEQ
jgi:hypothetical protein